MVIYMKKTYETLQQHNVFIPKQKEIRQNFGKDCLAFIRENCLGLKYNDEDDLREIPENFNHDVDRLCLENAVARFLETGSREDAFDVYFSYCEIFKPFGDSYNSTKIFLKTLSEHEENSSSLLTKHCDPYSYSVYTFLMGISIYKNNLDIRKAYNEKYNLTQANLACNHFIEHWGLASLFHNFVSYKKTNDFADILMLCEELHKENSKKTGHYASNTNYLNLYDFALALNARYDSDINISAQSSLENIMKVEDQMMQSFAKLSLEFKLSNIAQAKGFAKHLEQIKCFYTDKTVDYEMLTDFTAEEIDKLAKLEHDRWWREKEEMGWVYGTDYKNSTERALKRHHKDMVDFELLSQSDIDKDAEPMRLMMKLLKVFDGLNIYRL